MRTVAATLASLLAAIPAAAQPIIIELDHKPAEQAPQPSPVPVAPPQAEGNPGAPAQTPPGTAQPAPVPLNVPAQDAAPPAQPAPR